MTFKVYSNGIAVQIFNENEPCVRAVFCHNKYRFFTNGDFNHEEFDFVQKSENLTMKYWEEFKKKVKDRYDLIIDDSVKPGYVK